MLENLLKITVVLVALATSVHGKDFYVDSAASGLGNGASWNDAWTRLELINGVAPGDTVYISGGPAGGSQTYRPASLGANFPGIWVPKSGSPGLPIRYAVGQDVSHNGTVVFSGSGQYYWLG